MTPRGFGWLLRLRGPALAAWPDRERRDALALLRRSAPAREMLAAALADAADEDAADLAALARMQRGLGASLAARQAPARLVAGARWGALAACAAFGAWLGTAQAADQLVVDRDPLQAISSLSPVSPLGALQP